MATPATMRQLEDRQVDRAVIKMLWSPKMDILVVVFETNDISLFRLNWQRVSHKEPDSKFQASKEVSEQL